MRILSLAAAGLLLVACQPQAPDGAPAPPPADAPPPTQDAPAAEASRDIPAAFQGDLNLLGTEPFWSIQVRADTLTLTRPEPEPAIAGPNSGPTYADGVTTWTTTTAGGQALRISAAEDDCSDGMSDLSYPLTVEVQLGELRLRGCGAKAAEMPREGGN